MSQTRLLKGKLVKIDDFSEDCFQTPDLFADLLSKKLGIEFPVLDSDNFVLYGFQTPSEDDKGKLWYRTDRSDHFVGFYSFIDSKWRRVRDYTSDEVIWKYGDSRLLEEGFKVIDGTLGEMNTDLQNTLIENYFVPHADDAPSARVWAYYATIYEGV